MSARPVSVALSVLCVAIVSLSGGRVHAQPPTALVQSGVFTAAASAPAEFRDVRASDPAAAVFLGESSTLWTNFGGVPNMTLPFLISGQPLPAPYPVGDTFNRLSHSAVNDTGNLVFHATLNSAVGSGGIFFFDNTTGNVLPVSTPGAVADRRAELSNTDLVVFEQNGDLTGWLPGLPAPVTLVARFAPAPGTTGVFTSFTRSPVVSDNGLVAFTARVAGGANGVFFWDVATFAPTMIAVEGTVLPTGQTISQLDQRYGVSISPNGQLIAFQAELVGLGNGPNALVVYNVATGASAVVATNATIFAPFGAPTRFDDEFIGINDAGIVATECRFAGGVGARLCGVIPPAPLNIAVGAPLLSAREFPYRLPNTGQIVWEVSFTNANPGVYWWNGVGNMPLFTIATPSVWGRNHRARQPTMSDDGSLISFTTLHPVLYRWDAGTGVSVVARDGDPSPRGTGFLATLEGHDIDGSGDVAYHATDDTGQVLARVTPAGVTTLVADDTTIPVGAAFPVDLAVGTTFLDFDNVTGQLLYSTTLGGGASEAIIAGNTVLLTSGAPAPGGQTFTSLTTGPLEIGTTVVTFQATLSNGAIGLYQAPLAGGAATAVVQSGQASPVSGSAFATFGSFDTFGDGRVVFVASLASGVNGVYLWDNGTLAALAEESDASPTGGGDTFDFIYLQSPVGVGATYETFHAQLTPGLALLRRQGGVLSARLQEGDPGPVATGGTIATLSQTTPTLDVGHEALAHVAGDQSIFPTGLAGSSAANAIVAAQP